MSRILNEDEIVRLTGKVQRAAQARALRAMRIDFRYRPDGAIIVIDEDLPLSRRAENDDDGKVVINSDAA